MAMHYSKLIHISAPFPMVNETGQGGEEKAAPVSV